MKHVNEWSQGRFSRDFGTLIAWDLWVSTF